MLKKCIGICIILTFDTRLEAIKYWTAVRPGNARLVCRFCCPVQNQVIIQSIIQFIVQSRVQSRVQSPGFVPFPPQCRRHEDFRSTRGLCLEYGWFWTKTGVLCPRNCLPCSRMLSSTFMWPSAFILSLVCNACMVSYQTINQSIHHQSKNQSIVHSIVQSRVDSPGFTPILLH